MKTVNVRLTIQLDIKGDNPLKEVQAHLDYINGRIVNFEPNPQIFVESVDNSDITEIQNGFEIGDEVEVPEPNETDLHSHSFVGTIIDFRGDNAVIEDGEGNCFEIESDRL